jgi:multicomponent Na+:H+ antiporter subunit E
MKSPAAEAVPSTARTAVSRGLLLLLFWLVLMPSAKPADLLFGLIATGLATWCSLRLLPPAAGHLRLVALLVFVPHFLWQSVVAGLDVARRAFDPRLPLRPGLVDCPVRFPPGLARNEFSLITSLMPGSVPVAESEGSLIYHCLDTREPLVEQMNAEAERLERALVVGQAHD